MPYKPYSILTPPFDPLSGGIRVMYGLYGHLLAKGQIAYLNAQMDIPFIGIYPEIYHGNEMGADVVVRYILNKPGVMATYGVPGPSSFDSSDKIYVFSKIYDTFNSFDDKIMFLPILNLNLFKDQGKKRKGGCVFVGKGKDKDTKETLGLTRITRDLALDQAGLANFLNIHDVMYSFENPTAMNEIARLCGCRVVFVKERANLIYSERELEKLYEPGMYGVGFGRIPEFDSAKFRKHYVGLVDKFSKKLDRFISETQSD